MKNVFIQNKFFCRSRSLDIHRITLFLQENGYSIVEEPELADYILLSTCGTVDPVVEKSIKQINEMSKYDAELYVIGCLPDTDLDVMKSVYSGKYIRNVELNSLDEIFQSKVPFSKFENIQFDIVNSEMDIEVCRGCYEKCAYCAINKAIGTVKSMSLSTCQEKIKDALNKGVKRIVLGGDNLGPYGHDIGTNLSELLLSIDWPKDSHILRLNNLHPRYLGYNKDAILQLVNQGVIGLLKVPIQSGSQETLNAMRRACKIDEVTDILQKVKNIDPSVIVMTDIIVGYPGETKKNLQETIEFSIANIDLARVFMFSTKRSTQAEVLEKTVGLSKEEKENHMSIYIESAKEAGYFIDINDDFVYTICRPVDAFSEMNPFSDGIVELFHSEKDK